MMGRLKRILGLLRAGAGGLLGEALPEVIRPPRATALRRHGRTFSPGQLAGAYAEEAGGKGIVLFVHGLMADETCWDGRGFSMPEAFVRDFGVFDIRVRYNTGLHISENGLALAAMMEAFHRATNDSGPGYHIVAHSMGGLVARSALYQAWMTGMDFVRRVDRVFLLAVPNRGVILEKGVQAARLMLRAAPYLPFHYAGLAVRAVLRRIELGQGVSLAPAGEVADLFIRRLPAFYLKAAGSLLDLRSHGIRDLRYGYMLEEEWRREERFGGLLPDKLRVAPLPWARYYAVAGSLSTDAGDRPSPVVTDGMVTAASAANAGRDDELRLVERGRFRIAPGVSHFVMPFSRVVYGIISRWFAEP